MPASEGNLTPLGGLSRRLHPPSVYGHSRALRLQPGVGTSSASQGEVDVWTDRPNSVRESAGTLSMLRRVCANLERVGRASGRRLKRVAGT